MVRPKQTLNRRRRREIPLLRGKARKTISRRQKRVTSRNPMKKRTHRISRKGAGSALAPEPAPASARKPVQPLANLPRMAPRMVQHLKNHSKSIADYEKKMTELTTHTKLLEVENADLKRARKELEYAYLKMEDERNALGRVLQGANQNLIKKNFMISRLAQQKMFFAQALNEALNDKS
jgi:exonuclease VII small subunit